MKRRACGTADVCKLALVAPRPAARTRNIILVTGDGVRWQDVFGASCAGNLRALGEAGVAVGQASAMVSSGPKFVSLPGYREIVRGRAADDCTDNECARLTTPTLLDDFDDVAVVASWEQTPVIVTADHGRADDFRGHGEAPESARVWLMAAGGAVTPRGSLAAPRTLHLADIAPSIRALVQLPPRGTPIAELLPPAWLAQGTGAAYNPSSSR